MALETASYINQLVPANPSGADRVHQGDDHIRMLKAVLKNTFPNLTGPVTLTQAQLNGVYSLTVPVGIISIWYGAADAVPSGWAICNGQTVDRSDGDGEITVPDMRGRVVAGLVTGQAVGATFGQEKLTGLSTAAGGDHSHGGTATAAGEHNHGGKVGGTSLSVAQMPSHKHANGVTDVSPSLVFSRGTTTAAETTGDSIDNDSASGNVEGWTETVGGGQAHDHPINSAGAHSHTIAIGGAGDHNHAIPELTVVQPSIAFHFIMKI